jgi:outer membrane lipoprotein SlyB
MNSTSLDRSLVEPAPTHASPKVLWTAIGALAVAVAALGGVVLHQQGRDSAPEPASIAAAPSAQAPAPDDFKTVAPQSAIPAPPPASGAAAAVTPLPPPVRAPETLSPNVAQAGPAPAPSPAPARVCSVCGRVESVRAVQHAVPTTGVGAVAGGVVGGVVGNQIGHGNGRTAATLLGAVGGGFAGNEIEKRTHTVTAYEVSVRMQDGSLRTVETSTAPPIGKAVTLKGTVLRPADGRK